MEKDFSQHQIWSWFQGTHNQVIDFQWLWWSKTLNPTLRVISVLEDYSVLHFNNILLHDN